MRLISSIFFLLFTCILFCQNYKITNKKDKIQYLLEEAHQRGFFNGNALVVVEDQIIYQNEFGYAKADKSEKLKKDHIFKIGSVSKEFDGVALMLLHQRDELNLESSVSKYFPDLPSWAERININHLLQYTSGLPNLPNLDIRTDEQVWDFLSNLDTLNFEPGTSYLYNNLNTFLRKRIIEKVSGQTFSDFVKENILDPAGIKNAIIDPESHEPKLAEAFDVEFKKDTYPPYMSGWVALNITDLYKWITSLHSGKILNQRSMENLYQNFQNNQSTLGSVVMENGKLHYQYHHGQSGNYEASFYYNEREKFMVIFLTNQKGNNVGDLTNSIDAILRGEEFSIPKKSIELSLRSKIYYEGYEAGMRFYDSIKKNSFDIYNFKNEQKELLETVEFLVQYDRLKPAEKLLTYIIDEFKDPIKAREVLGKIQKEKIKAGS